MYKYFRELENPREFKTYLTRDSLDKKQDLSLYNISYSDDLLRELHFDPDKAGDVVRRHTKQLVREYKKIVK